MENMIYKKKMLLLGLFSMAFRLVAQSPNPIPQIYQGMPVNIIRTWTATAPEQNSLNLIGRPLTDVKQSTKYFDGFGRNIQIVAKQASPAGNDVVTANCYDPTTGNEIFKYLPFVSNTTNPYFSANDGVFKSDAFDEQVAFYNTYLNGQQNETSIGSKSLNWAYSKTNYEASPLNRVLTTLAPGANWVGSEGGQNHNIQQQTLVNTAADNVIMWNAATNKSATAQFTASPTLPAYGGAYPANTLYKTVSTDEVGHQVVEFKDQYGQIILKKVQNTASADNGTGSAHAGWLCTYYVYDDYGNLRFILTPNVVQLIDGNWGGITQAYVDELCYYFEYDNQNRMVIRKTPGTPTGINGEIWIVYDQRGRLVMQQDGYQRSAQKWKYNQYDGLDRIIATGFITDPSSNLSDYTNLSTHVNNAASSIAYPTISGYTSELLSQRFYDNYSWMNTTNSSTLPASLNSGSNGAGNGSFLPASNTTAPYAQPLTQSSMTHGMPTGRKIEVLGSNDGQFIYVVNFYDAQGRTVQTQSINYSRGTDISTNQYDWSGKVLISLVSHTLTSAATPQTHNIASIMSYDAMGRLLTINKTINSTINGTVVTASSLIETNQYDELSRLKKRTFGNNLESMTCDYNVRGWLLGANRDYAKTPLSTTNYFGFDLGYDQASITPTGGSSIGSYASQAYNGNVAGAVWKSRSDGVTRKFDYTYDNADRLLTAPYNESATVNNWSSSDLNFSVSNLGYDANGNIGSMQQYGFMVGGPQIIDNLTYNYNLGKDATTGANYSNRLLNVIDASNNAQSILGDLHYPNGKSSGNNDYGTYNPNGCITSDYNRNISSIGYYYDMNLPNTIAVANKGTIQYAYDAVGNKLQKQAVQNNATVVYNGTNYTSTITTTTKYIDGFVYKSLSYSNTTPSALPASLQYTDVLQFTGQEDGRIRLVQGSTPQFVFDYFMRDHLSNVRMVLTDEQQTDIYPPATLETVSKSVNGVTSSPEAFESQYYNINTGNIVAVGPLTWWNSVTGSSSLTNTNTNPPNNDPYSNPTATSANIYKLNGATGDKTGLGITLKVMAGDVVNIYGKSVWHNTGTSVVYHPITESLIGFLSAFASSNPVQILKGGTVTATVLNSAGATASPLTTMLNGTPGQTQNTTYTPKAAINWILFDDQFRPVSGSLGTSLVSATPDQIYAHPTIPLNISMVKSGYLYVYCSNESNVDVYFDNLQVSLTHGPMVEETHYYPIGLAMAGISDRAWGKTPNYYHYQGNEMQNQEWNDGTGLEEYDFKARLYDQQTGIWHSQDPASQFASPYLAMGNNWMRGTDKDGKWFGIDDAIAAFVGGMVNLWNNRGNLHGLGTVLGYFGAGAVGAWVGYNTFGAAGFATGGALNTVVDGFASHNGDFSKMDFHDFAVDIINGGTAALAGSDIGADLKTANGTLAVDRFGTSGYQSNSGLLRFLNKADEFLNGNLAQGNNWKGILGFIGNNLDQGLRNTLNFYANAADPRKTNGWDYLGALGIGMISNALGNASFNPNNDKAQFGSIPIRDIGNVFMRNVVQNGAGNILNNVHNAIDRGGDFGYYMASVFSDALPIGSDYGGYLDIGAFIQDVPILFAPFTHVP